MSDNSYESIYDDSSPIEDLDIKASQLPDRVATALRAIQDLGFATLIIYVADDNAFRFAAVKVDE